eukprot:328883-Hanusia_phi.AAC.1
MNVKNPAYAQKAPNVTVTGQLIPAAGTPTLFNGGRDYILLQNVDQTVPANVYEGSWHDGVPLEVRGSASFVKKTISQSSAQPGASNTITVKFTTSVPLSNGAGSRITLSGFHPLGDVTLGGSSGFSLDTSATTNTSVVVKVDSTTTAGTEYTLTLGITNPVKHTLSP